MNIVNEHNLQVRNRSELNEQEKLGGDLWRARWINLWQWPPKASNGYFNKSLT